MTPDPMLPWLTAINSLLVIGTAVYAWFTARAKGNSEKLDKLEDKVTDHDRRIQDVESEMRHLPDKDSVVELKISMAEVKGAVSGLADRLSGMGNTVTRIDNYLRTGGKD